MAKEKHKRRQARTPVPKRTPGAPIERPHVSRANPLADFLFSSITQEMVAAAGRGEEWPSANDQKSITDQVSQQPGQSPSAAPTKRADQSERSEKFSTTPPEFSGVGPPDFGGLQIQGPPEFSGVGPPDFGGLQARGFLALPHALLDQILAEIQHYSAFKVYICLYREAFRRVHDERLTAKCSIPLTVLTKQCGMPDSVVRDALKILARDGWIVIESRPGAPSFYAVNRPVGPPESGGPTPLESGGHLKNDHDKKDDDKERRSSSKKGRSFVENHKRLDDDSLPIIKAVYEELTGNTWTPRDTEAYATTPKTLKAEDIIRCMRVIHERTTKPVGSFAYFLKAILREQQSPKTRKTTLEQLRKIVESVRAGNIGRSNYSNADLREDVKTAAARAGVTYFPDLLEEALNGR